MALGVLVPFHFCIYLFRSDSQMREIKFRAWDKKKKTIITHSRLFRLDTSNELPFLPLLEKFTVDYEIMQCTGLKDKDGKDIYEGDILKRPSINNEVHGDYSYQEVVFRNGTWIVQYLRSEKGKILPRGYTAGELIDCYEYDQENLVFYEGNVKYTEIEVIGNIYENPNLLEESS
jgi:uncharacterized phage protein (TIGR01671 family)